jgi:protein SCO1/2
VKRAAAGLVFVAIVAGAALRPALADDFADLAFDPRPGAQLPLGEAFVDENGQAVTLSRYFTGKPVILILDYLRCKTLCGLTLARLMTSLGELPLELGRDYQFVSVSIDPRDKAADSQAAKTKYLALYGRADLGVDAHFLTGGEGSARRVAEAIGFRYRYDPALDQYVHPAGFVIAGSDGAVSRYVLSVGPSAVELDAALRDAAAGRKEGPLTRLLLLCHVEGAPLGRYTAPVLVALSLANLAAGAALIVLFGAIRRRHHG